MAWPAAIRIQTRPDGARYELPVRNLGALRFVGVALIVFGTLFGGGGLIGVVKALTVLAQKGFNIENVFSAIFALPFLVIGCVPLAIGLLVVWGHCRIELAQGAVVVRECFGPFFWRRKRSLKDVQKLSVAIGGTRVNGQPVTQGPLADLSALSAVFAEGKPWPIAIGYPLEWMRELAVELAQRLQDTGIPVAIDESSGQMRVVEEDWNRDTGARPALPEVDQPIQPAGSTVKLEPHGDGVMLTVPPAGLRKGSKGLFFFSILWNGFIGLFTAVMIAGMMSGKAKDLGIGLAFISVFWAIGIALLLSAINMGRRRAMLLADPRQFKVVRQSPFGVKQWAWPAKEITDVRLGPSGMTVNNVPVNELQVYTAGGRTGLFSERDDAELVWMATVIRGALKLKP